MKRNTYAIPPAHQRTGAYDDLLTVARKKAEIRKSNRKKMAFLRENFIPEIPYEDQVKILESWMTHLRTLLSATLPPEIDFFFLINLPGLPGVGVTFNICEPQDALVARLSATATSIAIDPLLADEDYGPSGKIG